MAYQLKTFIDFVNSILEMVKIQSTDTTTVNRIKRDINMTYLNEIVPQEQWKWLRGYLDITLEPAYSAGTATVTSGSKTVTLTVSPGISKKGYLFSINGQNERYRIAQHSATSTTLTLAVPYSGSTASTQSFQIWNDKAALPTDCRETVEISRDNSNESLEGVGISKFRKMSNPLPKSEGYPTIYNTGDWIDPAPYVAIAGISSSVSRSSDGLIKTLIFMSDVSSYLSEGQSIEISGASGDSYNGQWTISSVSTTTITFTGLTAAYETTTADTGITVKSLSISKDSERYRELNYWPSLNTVRSTLHVDYIRQTSALVNDTDEPLIPIQDRIVLLYGALEKAWNREGDETQSARYRALFEQKLQKMSGKLDDSVDFPVLRPDRGYLGNKRQAQRFRDRGFNGINFGGVGQGSSTTPIGTANTAAIFDSSGTLIGSTTVSTTELNKLDGILSLAVGVSDSQTLTNKTVDGSLNSLPNVVSSTVVGATPNVNGMSVTANNSITLQPASSGFPGVVTSATQQFAGAKTFMTALKVRDTAAAFDLSLASTSSAALSADRVLTVNVQNADRSVSLAGNLTVAGTASVTGTNTGDQTITLSSEASGSGTGSIAVTLANSAVIAKVLTGYVSGSGTVAATDTILQAIQKLNGNAALNAVLSANNTFTGTNTFAAAVIVSSTVTAKGITTGVAPAAGYVGEKIESLQGVVSAAVSGAWFDATSVSLTPGNWLLGGIISYHHNGATWSGVSKIGISTTTGNSSTGLNAGQNEGQTSANPTAIADVTLVIPPYGVNISATTTHYLKGLTSYSAGTAQYSARLSAFRIS